MDDKTKLAVATDALRAIAAQCINLRQGGCEPALDFEGLESGLTRAVEIADAVLEQIAAPPLRHPVRRFLPARALLYGAAIALLSASVAVYACPLVDLYRLPPVLGGASAVLALTGSMLEFWSWYPRSHPRADNSAADMHGAARP
ncbi:MAG TPA: hypothetical protein VF292_02900 [Rhodanobacteraceae bacterium]